MKRNIKNKSLVNHIGISLIEVVIVVAITGVIIALVLPDFNKVIGRYSLECAAREMVSDIRAVQQNAIKDENASFNMLFDVDIDSYYFKTDSGSSLYKIVKLPASVNLAYANYTQKQDYPYGLMFAANGNPVNGFGGHITLQDRATGDFLYVIIDSVGRVRISKTSP